MPTYSLHINGSQQNVDADADTPLLWVLRDHLDLRGTKYGCGIGMCGACTVHIDGVAMRSCSLPIERAVDMKITTIEGLSDQGNHPVQQAWIDKDVAQCGYCQAGQIMTAAALLNDNPNPTDEEIKQRMSANICRCATYLRIREAVKEAAKNT